MSEVISRDLGSFRDPSGYVFQHEARIFRAINESGYGNFHASNTSGVLQLGISNKLLIPFNIVNDETSKQLSKSIIGARGESAKLLIEHPKIPLISYPYEWVFSQLKDAALAHLDLQILLLKKDFELSDASAFNMQFFEGQMRHIDLLSVRPYMEGRPWEGYHQFCKQFLAPLVLESILGIPFQKLYRGLGEYIVKTVSIRV